MSIDGFLSFASEDSSEVDLLRSGLAVHGIQLWIARERPEPASPWHDAARGAIEHAPAVVLAISPAWVGSPPCAYELGLARGLGRPVLALLDLSAAMAVSRLPSVLGSSRVEPIDAGRSIARGVEAVAGRLRSRRPSSSS
jgi:hypothetical protein